MQRFFSFNFPSDYKSKCFEGPKFKFKKSKEEKKKENSYNYPEVDASIFSLY